MKSIDPDKWQPWQTAIKLNKLQFSFKIFLCTGKEFDKQTTMQIVLLKTMLKTNSIPRLCSFRVWRHYVYVHVHTYILEEHMVRMCVAPFVRLRPSGLKAARGQYTGTRRKLSCLRWLRLSTIGGATAPDGYGQGPASFRRPGSTGTTRAIGAEFFAIVTL